MREERYSKDCFSQNLSMNSEPLIIKKSRWKMFIYSVTSFSIGIAMLVNFLKESATKEASYNAFILFILLVLLTCTIYFAYELIKRKAEIILTNEGIELRDTGFFIWDDIEHFSIRHYSGENATQDLVLQLKDPWEVKIDITELPPRKEDIIDAILAYKGDAAVYYAGEERK